MDVKFVFVIGAHMRPTHVDDPTIEHDAAVLIESEERNYRVILGLNRDEKLSKPYEPYFARVLDKEKLIYLRDELTRLIDAN
jgi:hypothetical protein